MDRITWNYEAKNHFETLEESKLMEEILPELKNSDLQTKALRIALSSGAESVSVGMRNLEQPSFNKKALYFSSIPKESLIECLKKLNENKPKVNTMKTV